MFGCLGFRGLRCDRSVHIIIICLGFRGLRCDRSVHIIIICLDVWASEDLGAIEVFIVL